jgi:hypothetical protein
MNQTELGKILKRMYSNAPDGDQVAQIHLFGIKYAKDISNYSVSEIVRASGIKPSYATEVSKGIKLSKYVIPKG